MNSRLLVQASIPLLAVAAIWWWSGDDESEPQAPSLQGQTTQRPETAAPEHDGIPGYYGEDRQAAVNDQPSLPYAYSNVQRHPAQQYWAPEQTHFGPYRFRPLSDREKHRLYSTAPAYAEPRLHDFHPGSYARALPGPRPAYEAPDRYAPRWNDEQTGGYRYRPSDPSQSQDRRWRSGLDPAARRDRRYQQGPESWSSPEYRWTAKPPPWQSPAERMLPAAGTDLDPTLTSLFYNTSRGQL